jgi:4-amino-4-deoxy-L-arabinose transferase-like glycosyltransferase
MMTLETWLSRNRRIALALAAILGVYFVLGNVYALAAPAFEKPDEEWHYAYVRYLLAHGDLPPITTDGSLNPAQQEAGQPPLYYLLGASSARVLGLTGDQLPLRPNPYWAYPAPGIVDDNKNRYVHQPGEFFQPPFQIILWLRRLSVFLGAGTVVCAYGLSRAIGGSRSLALASATAVALLPQYLFVASSASNDALAASLSAAALWALVVALQRDSKIEPWLAFGVFAGLAALTKTSALVMPLLGMTVAAGLGVWRRSPKMIMVGVTASLGGLLLCVGWWYARNTLLYDDPLGLGIHFAKYGRERPLSLNGLAGQWDAIELSFWAAFGWGNVHLPGWMYWGLRLAELAALPGAALALAKHERADRRNTGLWVSVLYSAGIAAGLIWWTQSIAASLGRLLFPALAPLAVLIVVGLARLRKRSPVLWLAWLGIMALMAPIYIARAYEPPLKLVEAETPTDTQTTYLVFGDLARLYAFDVSPHRLAAGETATVRLCWRALSTTPIDYSVFVHVLGPANSIVGGRETYPGLGAFATSLWQVGDSFCDEYSVPISRDAPGPAIYGVEVGMFDLATGERLPAADGAGNRIDLVLVDRLKVIGPSAEIPPSAARLDSDFGDQIALVGYELGEVKPGQPLPITLYWQARTEIQSDYTIFLHLLDDAGEIVAQADSPPRAGLYPTHWWDAGERVADARIIELPTDLPAGSYQILVGLYLPETGERLPLVGSEENSVVLPTIEINR